MSALAGKRIVITRPRGSATAFQEELVRRGAVPILMPTIEIVPMEDYARLDETISQIARYDWLVFTSTNGVSVFWKRVMALGIDPRTLGVSIAAIGPATAETLRSRGFNVHHVPSEFVAERLLDGIGDVRGMRFLLPLAEIARKTVREDLERLGATVDEVPVYRTVPARITPEASSALHEGVDAVTFTSSSTVRSFHEMVTELPAGVAIVCIGPITARTAAEEGYRVDVVAEDYTTEGLLRALEGWFQSSAGMTASATQ